MEIIIAAIIIGAIIGWTFRWSPTARYTNELAKLNKIWTLFNDGQNPRYTILALEAETWKYHADKAGLLKGFARMKVQREFLKRTYGVTS